MHTSDLVAVAPIHPPTHRPIHPSIHPSTAHQNASRPDSRSDSPPNNARDNLYRHRRQRHRFTTSVRPTRRLRDMPEAGFTTSVPKGHEDHLPSSAQRRHTTSGLRGCISPEHRACGCRSVACITLKMHWVLEPGGSRGGALANLAVR